MKQVFLVALAVVLVVGLVFVGCAKETPTAPKEPYEVTFKVLSAKSSTYAIGIVLADQINKDSEWLRATCPEGINMDVNLKAVVQDVEARTHSFLWASNAGIWDANRHIGAYADPPFNTFDYNEFRPCFFWGMAGNILVTLNPEIKTIADLEGKKGMLDDTPGGNRWALFEVLFKNANVNVKPEFIKRAAAIEALKDGLIDFMNTGVEPQPAGAWKGGAGLPDLTATEDVYFIQMDPAVCEATIKEINHPGVVLTVPAGAMGATQPEPFITIANAMWWGAHESMPDEVVTEFMRVVYEYCETWVEYKADRAVCTKQTLGAIGVPESRYHPAALKFLKDKGVPITTYGMGE